MNKKFLSLVTAFLLTASTFITACGGGTVSSSSDKGNGGSSIGSGIGSGIGGSSDGSSSSSSGSQSGGNGGDDVGNDDYTPLENADLLALSYDRLKNADLSFNFEIKQTEHSSSKKSAVSKEISLLGGTSGKAEFETADTTDGKDDGKSDGKSDGKDDGKGENQGSGEIKTEPENYEKYPDANFEPDYSTNYFSSKQGQLDSMSQNARNLADYVVNNVTVMDTVVKDKYQTYRKYLLHYESASDVLTTVVYDEMGENENYSEIQIYYDADGVETVEMWTYVQENFSGGNYNGRTYHVIYAADKNYYISELFFSYDAATDSFSETYFVNTAFRGEDGMWKGMRCDYDLENPMITKQGEYDYANGMLYMNFLVETEGGIYSFGETLYPTRNGFELSDGIIAQETDGIGLKSYNLEGPGLAIDTNSHLTLFSVDGLSGWEKLVIRLDEDYELNNPYSTYWFRDENDYFLLNNGKKLYANSLYSLEYGWLVQKFPVTYPGAYIAEDGTEIPASEVDESNCILFCDAEMTIDRKNQRTNSAVLRLSLRDDDYAKRLQILGQCFEESGLSLKGIPNSMITGMADMWAKKTEYTDETYRHLFGTDFTPETIVPSYLQTAEEMTAFRTGWRDFFNSFDEITFDEMPERPANIGLLSYADGIKGEATLTENGFDFTGVTFTAQKNVVLSENGEYGVYVGFASADGSLIVDAFSTQTYARETMTFVGKTAVLPELSEGEYTLKSFFGRITQDGWIRLTEISCPAFTQFETFTIEREVDDGKFVGTYYAENGEIKLSVTFVDMQAPNFICDAVPVFEEGVWKVSYYKAEEDTVETLLSWITVEDNYDEEVPFTAENISFDGEPVQSEDALLVGVYTITLSDQAENTTTIVVTVAVASVENDGENDDKTEDGNEDKPEDEDQTQSGSTSENQGAGDTQNPPEEESNGGRVESID